MPLQVEDAWDGAIGLDNVGESFVNNSCSVSRAEKLTSPPKCSHGNGGRETSRVVWNQGH